MSINDFAITRNLGQPAKARQSVPASSLVCYAAFLVSVGFAAALVLGLVH